MGNLSLLRILTEGLDIGSMSPKEITEAIRTSKLEYSSSFWEWFGKSVVKGIKGTPIIASHYSNCSDIGQFRMKGDPEYKRAHSCTNSGIYFNLGEAPVKYGKYGYYAYLKFENPFRIKYYKSEVVNPLTGKNITLENISEEDIKFLEGKGFDSVMGSTGQVVAFSPKQIRFITDPELYK